MFAFTLHKQAYKSRAQMQQERGACARSMYGDTWRLEQCIAMWDWENAQSVCVGGKHARNQNKSRYKNFMQKPYNTKLVFDHTHFPHWFHSEMGNSACATQLTLYTQQWAFELCAQALCCVFFKVNMEEYKTMSDTQARKKRIIIIIIHSRQHKYYIYVYRPSLGLP